MTIFVEKKPISTMRKEDKTKIEDLLGKKSNEKLLMAKFSYDPNTCLLYPSTEIEYNSWETIRYEDVLDAENSEFKTIKTLKSVFPGLKKVFAYYNYLDGGHIIKDQLEADGWKVIHNDGDIVNGVKQETPMYETSCYFIFAVPKSYKLDFDRETEVNGVMVYG